MKSSEIQLGKKYVAIVSDRLAVVTITAKDPVRGWHAVNRRTGRCMHFKSAQRLRREYVTDDDLRHEMLARQDRREKLQ